VCLQGMYALGGNCLDGGRRFEKQGVGPAYGISIVGHGYGKPAVTPVIGVVVNSEGLRHSLLYTLPFVSVFLERHMRG
jgi:hypothetical protein